MSTANVDPMILGGEEVDRGASVVGNRQTLMGGLRYFSALVHIQSKEVPACGNLELMLGGGTNSICKAWRSSLSTAQVTTMCSPVGVKGVTATDDQYTVSWDGDVFQVLFHIICTGQLLWRMVTLCEMCVHLAQILAFSSDGLPCSTAGDGEKNLVRRYVIDGHIVYHSALDLGDIRAPVKDGYPVWDVCAPGANPGIKLRWPSMQYGWWQGEEPCQTLCYWWSHCVPQRWET